MKLEIVLCACTNWLARAGKALTFGEDKQFLLLQKGHAVTPLHYTTLQYNTLFTHATSRNDENFLKNVKKKRNNLKLLFLNLYKNLFLQRHLKVEISLAFLTYIGDKFQSFAAKN